MHGNRAYRIIESLLLEKTSKISKSSCKPTIDMGHNASHSTPIQHQVEVNARFSNRNYGREGDVIMIL